MSGLVELAVMLVVILVSAELFTSALDHLGERLNISRRDRIAVRGGRRALLETLVPLLAIAVGTSDQAVNQGIDFGAILGAPLMLSTLSTFLMTLAILRARGVTGSVVPERTGFTRDLNYFHCTFVLAAGATHVRTRR